MPVQPVSVRTPHRRLGVAVQWTGWASACAHITKICIGTR